MRQLLGISFLIAFSPFILIGFLATSAWDALLFGGDLFWLADEWVMGDEE